MAETVNPQITDSVTQTNVNVLGDAPAMAMGNVYQASAHSLGLMFENAVSAQQQLAIAAQAATVQGVMQIYSIDTAAGAAGIAEILKATDPNGESAAPPAAQGQAED
jgi:hypothetical protein